MRTVYKALTYLLVIVAFFVNVSDVFAQTNNVGPTFKVELKGSSYNVEARTIAFDLGIQNRTESFVDNLNYRIELHSGDKLADKGLIFSTLDFVVSETGKIDALIPQDSTRVTLKYTPPETIPGGKYFFKIFVYSDDNSFYGATYTKEPLFLTGRGGFIGLVRGFLDIEVGDGEVYGALEGPTIEEGVTPSLFLPARQNSKLFDVLANENIQVSYEVHHINEPDMVVHSGNDTLLSGDVDDIALLIPIPKWEGQRAGEHTAVLPSKMAQDKP
jgi:hypothetical protein